MNPMAVTMSIIAFIKYVQGLHDVGYLIDLDKPIKDHVPTTAPTMRSMPWKQAAWRRTQRRELRGRHANAVIEASLYA